MSRLAFPLLFLGLLCALAPWIAGLGDDRSLAATLADPQHVVDVDVLRNHTENRDLRYASDRDLAPFRNATMGRVASILAHGSERERRIAAAVLGAAGSDDAARPLIRAFEEEKAPTALAAIAVALAECRRPEAIEALIRAIRDRGGMAAYEAYRALKSEFGLNLALDANAWESWFDATRATRE